MTKTIPLHKFFTDIIYAGNQEIFAPYVKKSPFEDVQLNELINPSKWFDLKWGQFGQDLRVVPMNLEDMHRKGFEWVQTIYGLTILGKINYGNIALGVGTGHECIVYWLAKKLKKVFATDLFSGDWKSEESKEGDPDVIKNPEKYQPFEYPKERLKFLQMNGCDLSFEDNTFDIVFSLSSIEHFGGKDQSALAVKEMSRVLKPGGIAVIATEYVLNNVTHSDFFNEADLLEYIIKPGNMKLIQDINFNIPRIFIENPLKMPEERYSTPHLSLTDGRTIWTSIILFFEKSI